MSNPKSANQKPQEVLIDMSWMQKDAKLWIEQSNVPADENIFLEATLISISGHEAQCSLSNKQVVKKAIQYLYERADDYTDQDYHGYDDMIDMNIINDAELLMNLQIRYKQGLIFTYVGPTLLVVNPFSAIPKLVNKEKKFEYIGKIAIEKGNYKDLPSHVYAVGSEAYKNLFENNKKQAIVISGESGAGKTEIAKLCMNLLTSIGQFNLFKHDKHTLKEVGKNDLKVNTQDIKNLVLVNEGQVGIEYKILSCNPILESFGNAKTVRNNNSSRFGKYVQMMVNKKSQKIKGAVIVNYLLEKSRVVSQGAKERGFHIFYFMMQGMTAQELEPYYLSENGVKISYDQLNYLKNPSGLYTVQGVDDVASFIEIRDSMKLLGFIDNFNDIIKVVSAIQLLGNINFDDSSYGDQTGCQIVDQGVVKNVLQKVSTLLELDQNSVEMALSMRQIDVMKKIITKPLSKTDCLTMRDSWAKELYERLFNWLVDKLNFNIKPNGVLDDYLTIGLLDIYGFEVFDINGFDQIIINYSNEKLHQLYIQYVFKEEEEAFKIEGLQEFVSCIYLHNNQMVMDLMEKYPIGLFDLLDEGCKIKLDDDKLLSKIRSNPAKNPLLQNPKIQSRPTFIIIHTAKDVEYTITGFAEKNKDEPSILLLKTSSTSTNSLVKSLFPQIEEKDKPAAKSSLSKKIRIQMHDLMAELSNCDVHFIRCIKPNDEKTQLKLVQNFTLKQIRYLGVLDSLKVRKQNYPIRRSYNQFYKSYADMTKNKIYLHLVQENADFKELTRRIFSEFYPNMGPEWVLFGNQKIFIRLEAIPTIQKVYNERVAHKHKYAVILQRVWRKKQKRIVTGKLKLKACIRLQYWSRSWLSKQQLRLYLTQILLVQYYFKRAYAISQYHFCINQICQIQRIIRVFLWVRRFQKYKFNKSLLQLSIDRIFDRIRDQAAIVIQKYTRGYLVRKNNRKQVLQIREAGIQCKIRRVIVMLQKHVRGFLVRNRLKKMNRAAYYIQGYVRMRWLSDMFQRLRIKVVIIQRHVREWLAKKRDLHQNYEKYFIPMEMQLQQAKIREKECLFGVIEAPPLIQSYQPNTSCIPFSYFHPPIQPQYMKPIAPINPMPSIDETMECEIDTILPAQPKIKLFAFIIDIETHCDTSEYYGNSFSDGWKSLFQTGYLNTNCLQKVEVGGSHAFAVSSTGRLYAWGCNDFGQLGIKGSQEPIKPTTVPIDIRVTQVSAGIDHTLILLENGQVLSCGSNLQGQQAESNSYHRELHQLDFPFPITSIKTTNNTSFVINDQGQVYTWPTRKTIPVPITPQGQKITAISAGYQFALLLSEVGQVYSFGQNTNGELGLGDTKLRALPTNIAFPTGQVVEQISCGMKHCVARTTSGRVFTWGWGAQGQLGNGELVDNNNPTLLTTRYKVIQVHACNKSTLLLMDDGKLYWCGTNATISYQSQITQFNISVKSNFLQQQAITLVRVCSTSSRSLSLIWCTFADHRGLLEKHPTVLRRVLNTLTAKWAEKSSNSVDPPYIESIANYFVEAHQKIPQYFSSPSKLQDPSIRQSAMSNIRPSAMASYMTKNRSPNNKNQNDMSPNNIMTPNNIMAPNNKTPVRIIKQPPTIKITSTPKSNQISASQTPNKTPKGNTPRNLIPRIQTQSDQKLSKEIPQITENNEQRLKALREMKSRIIRLKNLNKDSWSQTDKEFIEQIYKNDISVLIETCFF